MKLLLTILFTILSYISCQGSNLLNFNNINIGEQLKSILKKDWKAQLPAELKKKIASFKKPFGLHQMENNEMPVHHFMKLAKNHKFNRHTL